MRTGMPAVVLRTGLAIATALAQPMLAQDGTVTFTTKNGVQNVQYTHGQQVRLEMNQGQHTGQLAIILDGSTGMMTMLSADQKMYMQTPASAASPGAQVRKGQPLS